MGRRKKRQSIRYEDLALVATHHQHLLNLMPEVGMLRSAEYASELEDDLQILASEEKEYFSYYRKAGNEIVTEFSELLQANGEFKIARTIIGGSIGKNTALGIEATPDFDVVFFINDVNPPFTDIVKTFRKILQTQPHRFLNIEKTRFSVQFSVEAALPLPTGLKHVRIQFDVLPAANYTQHPVFYVEKQKKQTSKYIARTSKPKKNWYLFSASLTEANVNWVKNQSEFIHHLIILAKMWDHQLKKLMNEKKAKSSKCSGRSAFIELIATQAGHDTESGKNILIGFRRFLNLMRGFDNLHIDFIPSHEGTFDSEEGPLVRDEVNPYNNYAAAVNPHNISQFMSWASLTRNYINRLARSDSGQNYESNLKKLKTTFFGTE